MGNLVESIARICAALREGDVEAAAGIADRELATPIGFSAHRRYTPKEQTSLFLRDGFTDRFSGDRVVFPPVLSLVSMHLKTHFPYHPQLLPPRCHAMYWDLEPTIVQVTADMQGHLPRPSNPNWVTTSIRRAAIKGDQDAQAFGWSLYPAGDLKKWDGLLPWFVAFAERTNMFASHEFLSPLGIEGDKRKSDLVQQSFGPWYHAARQATGVVSLE